MINVILADHQRIYRIGMAGALAAEDDIRIVGQPTSTDQLLNGLETFRAHVLVLSSAFIGGIEQIKRIASRQNTAILRLEDSTQPTVRPSSDVQGVMLRAAAESTAIRCIRHLARSRRVLCLARQHYSGDEWQESLAVPERLTDMELGIIDLVIQGYRNRQIAIHVGTTEQGVKNSLRKIFDKTGVFDRLELALFVLHHGIALSSQSAKRSTATLAPLRGARLLPDMGYRRAFN